MNIRSTSAQSKGSEGARRARNAGGSPQRYCSNCGYGFSRTQWERALFCTHCGIRLKQMARPPKSAVGGFVCFGCGRRLTRVERQGTQNCPDCGREFRRNHNTSRSFRLPQVDIALNPYGSPRRIQRGFAGLLSGKAQVALDLARERPFLTAVGTGLAGGGMFFGGKAIGAFGATVCTIGGVVMGVSMLGALFTAKAGAGGSAKTELEGIGIGMGLVVAGTGLIISGQVIMVGGCVAMAGSAGLAGYGVLKEVQKRRGALGAEEVSLVASSGGYNMPVGIGR